MFSLGLALQGAASRTAKPDVRATIDTQINEVDAIIREIRAAVFPLDRRPPSPPGEAEPT